MDHIRALIACDSIRQYLRASLALDGGDRPSPGYELIEQGISIPRAEGAEELTHTEAGLEIGV